jgi:hypothetical protein
MEYTLAHHSGMEINFPTAKKVLVNFLSVRLWDKPGKYQMKSYASLQQDYSHLDGVSGCENETVTHLPPNVVGIWCGVAIC